VVCAGNTENFACAGFNPSGSTDDAEQNFLGSGPLGFDRWDLLYPLAPKPLLVVVSDKHFFGTYSSQYIASGREEFEKLRKVYEILGRAEQVEWHATPLPHGLSYDSRMQVYRWFGRWLRGEREPVKEEPTTQPEPDATLWVAGSGNVVRSFGGQTPFTRNRARQVTRKRGSLTELLGVEPVGRALARAGLQPRSLGRVRLLDGVEVEAVEIQSAPEVWVPAWVFRPRQAVPGKLPLVAVEPGGRNARWREGQLYQELATTGRTVWVPDLRGVGDLTPEFAAALEPGITELYLAGGLESFRSVVETEDYDHPFANFVPRLLEYTDLPEVAAALAPRRVVRMAEGVWGRDLLSF
jgi:hypothetical protein